MSSPTGQDLRFAVLPTPAGPLTVVVDAAGTVCGAGFGPTVRLPSAPEQVKGHADQILLRIILEKSQADLLLSRIKTAFAGTRLIYWIMPVTEFGILDDRDPEADH